MSSPCRQARALLRLSLVRTDSAACACIGTDLRETARGACFAHAMTHFKFARFTSSARKAVGLDRAISASLAAAGACVATSAPCVTWATRRACLACVLARLILVFITNVASDLRACHRTESLWANSTQTLLKGVGARVSYCAGPFVPSLQVSMNSHWRSDVCWVVWSRTARGGGPIVRAHRYLCRSLPTSSCHASTPHSLQTAVPA